MREKILNPTLPKVVFRRSKGHDLKNFSGGKPPDLQFLLTPFARFYSFSIQTNLSPVTTMVVKVVQRKLT